ncbi:MAG: hypothetical protein F6J93_30890 [Oscillatoria sp. SIO1A7]|nr:hypothetical protein [Oscillatoria sp. SIO1A7]
MSYFELRTKNYLLNENLLEIVSLKKMQDQDISKKKDGDFTEARELFEEMVGWLSSDSVAGLEHSELEKSLYVNGNELLRRLLQGYLDRRQQDELEEDCIGSDGVKRTHKRQQSRKLTTIFGTVVVSRIGYGGRKITSLKPEEWRIKFTTRTILTWGAFQFCTPTA